MDPLDDPFAAIDRELEACQLARQADAVDRRLSTPRRLEREAGHGPPSRRPGRRSSIGTHTHVPTADYQILQGGTAFQSDAGMCGDYNSVIGMVKEEPLRRFLTKVPGDRFTPAQGAATLAGIAVEVDDSTGLATACAPLRIGGSLAETIPAFWG
jgi:calcineurin-like phosphoesterase